MRVRDAFVIVNAADDAYLCVHLQKRSESSCAIIDERKKEVEGVGEDERKEQSPELEQQQ